MENNVVEAVLERDRRLKELDTTDKDYNNQCMVIKADFNYAISRILYPEFSERNT